MFMSNMRSVSGLYAGKLTAAEKAKRHKVKTTRNLLHIFLLFLVMRPVTLLELYVMFRASFLGKYPLLADGVPPGPFQVFSFAVDFSFFKKLWRHLARWANFEWTSCQLSLRHLNILNPQPAVWIGWDFTQEASNYLRDFVGNRPVQSAQALAKPWNP